MLCRVFQFMISSAADSDGRLRPLTRRHVLRCERCRRFYRICRTLGRSLRSEAVPSPVSRRFTDEVLSRLPRTLRHWPLKWAWPTVAAACIAMAVSIALWPRHAEPAPAPIPPAYTIAIPQVELTRAWAQVVEAPLTTEFRHLSNEAQSGIRFLVACLNVGPSQGPIPSQLGDSATPPVQ